MSTLSTSDAFKMPRPSPARSHLDAGETLSVAVPEVKLASATWIPVWDEEEAARYDRAIDSVAIALKDRDLIGMYGGSLASGSAGVALFYDQLWKTDGDHRWRELAAEWLSHAIDWVARQDPPPYLAGGSLGVAWVAQHLARNMPGTDLSLCERVDKVLLEQCAESPSRSRFDLAAGLVGCGVYALARLDQPAGRVLLELVVERLAELAMETKEGVTWLTPPHFMPESLLPKFPDGGFNLGLAHGVPGVIGLLGRACAADVALAATARPLLSRAIDWLLAQQNPPGSESCFGDLLPREGRDTNRTTRIAYCYGDLGLSAALLLAARCVDEPLWEQKAVQIGSIAAARPMERTGVRDAGICHGAAGNGHIFNRMFQSTGDPRFLDASRRSFARALDFYHPFSGFGGFRSWRRSSESGVSPWRVSPGLAGGTAGIALTFLAATTALEPTWDQVLMLGIAPRPF